MSPYRPPKRCGCGKIPYDSEAAVEAAIGRRGADPEFEEVVLRAYKCPGTDVWHMASRGFRPDALKSRNRIVAWYLSQGVRNRGGLLWELGLRTEEQQASRQAERVGTILGGFARLGLIAQDSPRRGYYEVVDRDGLYRVMQIGLAEYAAGRGLVMNSHGRSGPTRTG